MSALTTATATARTRTTAPQQIPQERPQLRVVPRRSRRTWPYMLSICLVIGAGVFGIISLSALAAEAAFAARELEANIEELSIHYDELTAEVAALESPGRVRAAATEELGMIPSETPAFLVVERPLRPPVVDDGGAQRAQGIADPVKQAFGTGG